MDDGAMRLFVLIVLIFPLGCAHFVKVHSVKRKDDYIKQVQVYNKAISQVKASIRISASNFFSESPKEEADVILQAPYNIYWSLRSFFGPPSMVFASNGKCFTMYDFSGQSLEAYHKFTISPDSIFELLEFCFHPESIIALLMGK
jgi:outer membrane lipoprotein-sorting protein